VAIEAISEASAIIFRNILFSLNFRLV